MPERVRKQRLVLTLGAMIALSLLLLLALLLEATLSRVLPSLWAGLVIILGLGASAGAIVAVAIQRYSSRLQASLNARTASLNAALSEASRAHADSHRMIAYLGHDLRSPLGTILHYVHLLASSSGQLSRHYQEVIERSVTHQLELIDELMEYTRGELDHLKLAPEPTYVHAFLQELAHQGELLAEQRGNRFKLLVDDRLPAVAVIDAKRLKQVLLNLLSNASKFTESGSIRMRVEMDDTTPAMLQFSVSDTGFGIADEDLSGIFKPYERRAKKRLGLGLGLAIADTIVGKMQGKLEVESAVGMGSRFWFRIPLQVAQEQDVLLPLHAFAVPEPFGSGKRVLIIERQPSSRDYLTEILSLADFDVVAAATPEEATPFLEAGHFGAILAMQEEGSDSGWRILQIADEQLGPSSPPLILCSASPARRPSFMPAETDVATALLKPLTPEKLLQAMRDIFEDERELSSLEKQSPEAGIPEEMFATLREMIALGNVSDILEWALEVERGYPEQSDFTLALRNAALRIDFKALALLASKQY